MGQLNIRDFPDQLIRKAKMFGFERSMTLREVVIQAMETLVGSEPHKAEQSSPEPTSEHAGDALSYTLGMRETNSADMERTRKSRFSRLPVLGEK